MRFLLNVEMFPSNQSHHLLKQNASQLQVAHAKIPKIKNLSTILRGSENKREREILLQSIISTAE